MRHAPPARQGLGHGRGRPPTAELLAALAVPAKARPEQVIVITVTAWDVNCPQHIPVKLDAADVEPALARLQARISGLERENARLRAARDE